MNRNYNRPAVDPQWAASRNTHPAVAMAIHAIADRQRSPEAIWEAPTPAEWEHVTMAVEDYLVHGDFEPEADYGYQWGEETVIVVLSLAPPTLI